MNNHTEISTKNTNYLTIYLDRRLTTTPYYYWSPKEAFDKKAPEWVLEIFRLPGVEMVTVDQHRVSITKGKMFSWDGIIDPALDILWEEFEEECY